MDSIVWSDGRLVVYLSLIAVWLSSVFALMNRVWFRAKRKEKSDQIAPPASIVSLLPILIKECWEMIFWLHNIKAPLESSHSDWLIWVKSNQELIDEWQATKPKYSWPTRMQRTWRSLPTFPTRPLISDYTVYLNRIWWRHNHESWLILSMVITIRNVLS